MAGKVSPGAPLSTSPLRKAGVVNDILDATAFVKNQFLGSGGQSPSAGVLTDCVTVKNLTGADRVRGQCVQLGSTLLTTTDNDNLWFEGNTPAAPVTQRYAILRDPLLSNGFGLAQISGVCIGRVNVSNTAHRYATPVASSTVMNSAESGPIELLQVPGGTGEQDIVVRVFSPPTAVNFAIIRFTITAVGPPITADVVKTTGIYAVAASVTLTNPIVWTIQTSMKGWAIDHGDGTLEIFSIDCPAA